MQTDLANIQTNTFITDQCGSYVTLNEEVALGVNKMYTFSNPKSGELNFNLVISAIIVLSTIMSIFML